MEFTYDQLADGIYYFLSLYPNEQFTKEELLQGLEKDKICPEYFNTSITRNRSSYFDKCCADVSNNYKNVYYDGDRYSLIKMSSKYNFKQIENIINNPDMYPDVTFDKIYENGQTLLHIVCSENRFDLLEKIGKLYAIDFYTKNESGQFLYDVISNTNSGVLTMRTLVKLLTNQMKETHDGMLIEIKKLNTFLQKKNNEMYYLNNTLMDKNKDLTTKVFIYKAIMMMMMIFMCLMYMYI